MKIGFATDHNGCVLKEPTPKSALQFKQVMP